MKHVLFVLADSKKRKRVVTDISDDDASDTIDEYARILGSQSRQDTLRPATKESVIQAVNEVVEQFPTRSGRGAQMPKPTQV